MRLQGEVALVTGAGSGIGRAIALRFAIEGADVVVIGRSHESIEWTSQEVRKLGRHVLTIKADISHRREVDQMVNKAVQTFGKIDILVNNAGVQGPIGPVVENDIDQWIKTVNVNLIGTFLCTRAVLPAMIRQNKGKIINLSGGGATSPRPRFSAYAASKAAVVRLTETIAEEVKDYNIQVNAIAPGAVNTRMQEEVLASGDVVAMQEARRILTTVGIPPEKAAELAVFLASDASNGLTGRLISAAWDDWKMMDIKKVMSSDLYTLRRKVT
ncbi:L-rhamnose 1-dehydrogenase (NADP(+)) [uncultured archaeon]|nr:L-rhamnose 1-dehydrogenase (NADP(+)) [uncultured archaeon]